MEPIYWKAPEEKSPPPPESREPNAFLGAFKFLCCVIFLAVCLLWWLSVDSIFAKAVLAVVLYIPAQVCGEYVSGKLFSEGISQSISRAEFSIARVFYGVVVTLLLYGFVFLLVAIFKWLL